MLQVTPITSFDQLPLILKLEDMAAIYRRGKSTILRDLKAGTFRPAPFTSDPYMWYRDEVRRFFEKEQHSRMAHAGADLRDRRSRRGNRKKIA